MTVAPPATRHPSARLTGRRASHHAQLLAGPSRAAAVILQARGMTATLSRRGVLVAPLLLVLPLNASAAAEEVPLPLDPAAMMLTAADLDAA